MSDIRDVARRAGVSVSTVSYAFSGKRPVSPETYQRIMQTADKLGLVTVSGGKVGPSPLLTAGHLRDVPPPRPLCSKASGLLT